MSSETIDVKFEHIKTFSFLHGELPIHLVDEVNNYVDEKGEINLDDDSPKSISFTSLLYLKVPEQINVNNKHSGGCTYFNWGTNTQADHFSLKPKQDKFTVPQVGRFILFPSWLKHSMIPFSGDGVLRVLLANFKVRFTL